ncbi:MAG: SCO family protein [Acidobacteria bacterium]|nr:SCO family protein [Acidobacteriota bacterium]
MFSGIKSVVVTALVLSGTLAAQPGQLLGPATQSSLQDGNLKPALPGALAGVGIDQRLNAQLPLDTTFKDDYGRTVKLRDYFEGGKPVILVPVYYRCPMLCTQIMNAVAGSLRAVSLDAGKDFQVVAVSFDPKDTPETAAEKKQLYLRRYARPNAANGWHLLSGDEANIKQLMDALGFHYRYDPKTDQYAHASGVMIATPDGHLSRYFYGIEYSPRDVRLGLVEASQNKIGNPVDQILLYCFHYDPATGKYGAVAMNLVRAAGAGLVLIGGTVLAIVLRRDVKSSRAAKERVG